MTEMLFLTICLIWGMGVILNIVWLDDLQDEIRIDLRQKLGHPPEERAVVTMAYLESFAWPVFMTWNVCEVFWEYITKFWKDEGR